jgi:lysozyme
MTDEGLEVLKRHEGLRLKAYRCPAKKLTIGYGHTAGVYEGMTITKERAEQYLLGDIAMATQDSMNLIYNFMSLPECPRRDAIVNMAFNMGYTVFSKFTTSLNYMRIGQWHMAAQSLRRSAWYKQVGSRALEVVWAIETNQWMKNDKQELPDVSHPPRNGGQ